MESQIELRALRECLDKWEATVSEIRNDTYSLKTLPKDDDKLQAMAVKLGKIRQEADAWGFDDLHIVALRTQQMIFDIKLGTLQWDDRTADNLLDGLSTLSATLMLCEQGFLRRQSTSNMLRLLLPESDHAGAKNGESQPK